MIEAVNITKCFKVRKNGEWRYIKAVDNVSFEVSDGEVFSLVGPNGAGKTTLVKILAGLMLPDSGTAIINGFDIGRDIRKVKSICHFVLSGEWMKLFYGLTVRKNLIKFGRIYGLSDYIINERISEVSDTLGLSGKMDFLVDSLSTGENQKVALASAFIVRTPVLYLDEPTRSLDPVSASTVRMFIRKVLNNDLGTTVFIVTQYTEEAELLSDKVGIMVDGRMLAVGRLEDFRSRFQDSYKVVEVKISDFKPALADLIKNIGDVRDVSLKPVDSILGSYLIRIYTNEPASVSEEVVRLSGALKCVIEYLKTVRPSLEEIFIELVRGGNNG